MEISKIKVGNVYEAASRQLRRVLRLTPLHVWYEMQSPRPRFYRVSVFKQEFVADVMREHGGED